MTTRPDSVDKILQTIVVRRHSDNTLISQLLYSDHDVRPAGRTSYTLQPQHAILLSTAVNSAKLALADAQSISLQFESGHIESVGLQSHLGTFKSACMLNISRAVVDTSTPTLEDLSVSYSQGYSSTGQFDEDTLRSFKLFWAMDRRALPSLKRLTLHDIPCSIAPSLPPKLVKLDLTFAHSNSSLDIQGLMKLLRELEALEELVLCDFEGVLRSPTPQSTENQTVPLLRLECLRLKDRLPRLIEMLSFLHLPSVTSVTLEIMDNRSTNPRTREVASEALLRDLAQTWKTSLVGPAPVFDCFDLFMVERQPIFDFRAWSQGSKAELRVSLAQADTGLDGLLIFLDEVKPMSYCISTLSIAPYAGNVEHAIPAATTLREVLQAFPNVVKLDIVGRIHGHVLEALLRVTYDTQSQTVLPGLSLLTVTVSNIVQCDREPLGGWIGWKLQEWGWDDSRKLAFKLRNEPDVTMSEFDERAVTTSELTEWAKTFRELGVDVELEGPPEFNAQVLDNDDNDVDMSPPSPTDGTDDLIERTTLLSI
ncbi:hypothetical protein PENSPDRAFT_433053 [Peniophora sp. CONT]|nr:hypothetical protein PENSPDRAFT_433053 [Peniophora sp. CONT]